MTQIFHKISQWHYTFDSEIPSILTTDTGSFLCDFNYPDLCMSRTQAAEPWKWVSCSSGDSFFS